MVVNRLGKGLQALIPDVPPEESIERRDSIREIQVSLISPNPFQPREEFDEAALEELKQSIAEKGLIQPITVRKFNNGYQLISGERRLRAVTALGIAAIPAYILNVTSDSDMLELSLIENIQREDLNPMDIAKGYQRLLTECQLTQEDVAKKVGKNRTTVTNFLRLLKLPLPIQESLKKSELDMGHARALISIEDTQLQLEIWRKIIKEKLSVRNVENLVKRKPKSTDSEGNQPVQRPFYIIEAENKLQEKFATKVIIHNNKKGGSIQIEYYSEDELDRILELVSQL
jgi:ParB family transcriptional regulator, chromosome partitioning protein